ncbi:retrovirus-related pol polyprotein from transposon TNT 1-94, partial [Tanacetum coccineum]
VERCNSNLVEAACIMLIFSRLPEAEAVSTACFTQNQSIIHSRYNKTPHELLHGRLSNVEYFHVFGSLCYPTNERDDLGKMKPKADIAESMNIPFKEDLDNLFGPMYEEYFEKRSSETSINSVAQQVHNHKDSPLTSSIVDEFNLEDSTNFDGNTVFVPYDVPNFKEAELSTTTLDPSNMHEFHQVQPSTHIWTKAHPLEQLIGDPSKPVMSRQRLQTDSEVFMYALAVSTLEPKNIKEAMLDHN